MKFFRALLLAATAALLLTTPVRAADQRSVLDNLNGQPSAWVQALRDTFGKVYLTVSVYNLSTASNAVSPAGGYVVSPVSGKITAIYSVITASASAAIDTATVLVTSVNQHGTYTEVTGGNVTIGAAAADVRGTSDSATPTGNRDVLAGSVIRIESMGQMSTLIDAVITIEVDRDF